MGMETENVLMAGMAEKRCFVVSLYVLLRFICTLIPSS